MKLLMPVFIILAIIFFLLGMAIFIAQTLTFLASQAFYDIYFHSGAWAAYLLVFVGMILFIYLTFIVIRSGNKYWIKKKLDVLKASAASLSLSNKILIVLVLFQILKLYLKKIRSN